MTFIKYLLWTAVGIALAGTALAQTAADDPSLIDDGAWKNVPWLDSYVPGEFICVKPHADYVGSNRIEVVWMTEEPGSGWVDWTQDDWATTNRAWTSKYGIRDYNERIHKIAVTGFEPTKPLVWRAVSMKLIQVATGHIRFEGEPNFKWWDRKNWSNLSIRRRTYESGAVVHMEEGVVNPLFPAAGKASFVIFNDTHHGLGIYTNMLRYAGKDVGLAFFNGDIIDHCRSEADIVKYVGAPMAQVGRRLHCATRYIRGNHECVQAFPRHLADYVGLQDGQFYGAVDFGPARIAFLDTGTSAPDDAELKGRDEWDFDNYTAEQAAWLAREVESPEWKRAKYRIVVAHIPPVYLRQGKIAPDCDRILKLFQVMNGKGVSIMLGAHRHWPHRIEPNEFVDFPILVGGAPSMKGATIMRCEMDAESIRVKVIDANGVLAVDWGLPARPCRATTPVPLNSNTNHYWWAVHQYRVNQMKTAPRAPDFVLLGDSIFHYWDVKENQPSWKKNFSGEGDAPFFGVNLAIEGDTTESLLWRLKNGLLTENGLHPKVAFVLIGTNNTSHRGKNGAETAAETAEGVAAIVDFVQTVTKGETKVVVYSLLPRGKEADDFYALRNRRVNAYLKNLAGTKVSYRNLFPKFTTKEGAANYDFLPDGLHAGAKGFEILAADILDALKALKIKPSAPEATPGANQPK